MTQPELHGSTVQPVMEMLTEAGSEAFAEALRILVNEAMKIERSAALHAGPCERTGNRLGYANGYKPKTVATRLRKIPFSVRQVRGNVDFYPSALQRGVRSGLALTPAVAERYLQGVSTRKVARVVESLCGLEVTSTQVSRAAALLDEELGKWRNRPLGDVAVKYLVLDARHEKVRYAGAVRRCAVLIAYGVRADGKRTVLGVSVSLTEAETYWREFLGSLQERGLRGVTYVVSDDHPGLKAALNACFAGVLRQRCQTHLQRNAAAHVPKVAMRKKVAEELIYSMPPTARKPKDG